MSTLERIHTHFSESIQTKINAADTLAEAIAHASEKMVQTLLDGHKIMTCGNGGSARDALHFVAKMLNHVKQERPGLPAIALTTDNSRLSNFTNDLHHHDIFAKQVRALGQAGDLLLAITTSGNSNNILNAIKAAQDKNIRVIALTGQDGGKIPDFMTELDIEIRVPSSDSARIHETHLLVIHCLSDIVDHQLFGHGDINT